MELMNLNIIEGHIPKQHPVYTSALRDIRVRTLALPA